MSKEKNEMRIEVSMLAPTKEAEQDIDTILSAFAAVLCRTASQHAVMEGRFEVEHEDVLYSLEKVLDAGLKSFERTIGKDRKRKARTDPSNN